MKKSALEYTCTAHDQLNAARTNLFKALSAVSRRNNQSAPERVALDAAYAAALDADKATFNAIRELHKAAEVSK